MRPGRRVDGRLVDIAGVRRPRRGRDRARIDAILNWKQPPDRRWMSRGVWPCVQDDSARELCDSGLELNLWSVAVS